MACARPSFDLPSGTSIGCRAYSRLCLVHHCLALPVRLTNMVHIHNYVRSIHVKNLMDEQSETLAKPKRLSGH